MRFASKNRFVLPLACAALLAPVTRANAPLPGLPLHALIVGGGPNLEYNQAAIESNVRYVGKLLPSDAVRATLFADGNAEHPTVLYEDASAAQTTGERLLDLAFFDPDTISADALHYRKPDLGAKLDGPCSPDAFHKALAEVAGKGPNAPLLLYFTGHGSPGDRKFENNLYDMWGEKTLSVRQLAQQIADLPEATPVTLIMVQCHSGAFANLLFEGGFADGKPIARDIAGFFASTPDRVAAGCTSETDETEYHDFTSYFFAALTGLDRLGRKVVGADFNGDGRVGMDEAYCYTLANDRSIDAPVCTSDIFLRRFVLTKPETIFATPYHSVRSWATPAQRYALDALAKSLRREQGENRLQRAYRDLNEGERNPKIDAPTRRERKRTLNSLRAEAQRSLLARWPDLRDQDLPDFAQARKQAIAYLKQNAGSAKWKALLEADDALLQTDADNEAQEIVDAHLLRFVWLSKSVILAHRLRQSGAPALKARFAKLLEAESRSLLPPVGNRADFSRH